MTVRELIQALSKLPPDKTVEGLESLRDNRERTFDVESVYDPGAMHDTVFLRVYVIQEG